MDTDIKAKQVKLVGVEGISIISTSDALAMAEDEGMNLVAMNNDEIPVCKIMDYSKFLYNQQKKAKQATKNKSELKEIKFNPTIHSI